MEPSGDEAVQALQAMDKQQIIDMLLRAQSALGGRILSPPPSQLSIPADEQPGVFRPVPVPPPAHSFLKYTLPTPRNASGGGMSGNSQNQGQQSSNFGASGWHHQNTTNDQGGNASTNNNNGGGWAAGNINNPQPNTNDNWRNTDNTNTGGAWATNTNNNQPLHTNNSWGNSSNINNDNNGNDAWANTAPPPGSGPNYVQKLGQGVTKPPSLASSPGSPAIPTPWANPANSGESGPARGW